MPSQDSLEQATRQAGIAAPPRYLEETASTNADALTMAAHGAPEWTVVAAGHQRAGRGRLGRSWTSAPGKSLLLSVVLRPPLPPDRIGVISLVAATEMATACGPGRVVTKWPNDLLARDRKVGGVLPEARVAGGRVEHLVLGIGVNVSMTEDEFPADLRGRATSLAMEGLDVEAGELLRRFLVSFRARYRPADPRFPAEVVSDYATLCSTVGRSVRATRLDGGTVEGLAVGIDERGSLIVRDATAEHAVAFGAVAHLA